jgi:hypothetical protein
METRKAGGQTAGFSAIPNIPIVILGEAKGLCIFLAQTRYTGSSLRSG